MGKSLLGLLMAALAGLGLTTVNRTERGLIPAPASDAASAAPGTSPQKAVLAGGCFWGIQAVYQHVRGVQQAVSGYSGGSAASAHYQVVSTGGTGHAEAVEITYDPSEVSYGQLLHVFFSVAHDPTTLNRQGPDTGTQYRSAIFVTSAEQEQIARAYIAQLDTAHVFDQPIVTSVTSLQAFYVAEAYHQDYATRHPYDPYILFNDAPKVANLKKVFPGSYISR